MSDDKKMIDGIVFSVQHLVICRDEPSMAEEIMVSSGYTEKEFMAAQKRTGFHTKQINKVIMNAFRHRT